MGSGKVTGGGAAHSGSRVRPDARQSMASAVRAGRRQLHGVGAGALLGRGWPAPEAWRALARERLEHWGAVASYRAARWASRVGHNGSKGTDRRAAAPDRMQASGSASACGIQRARRRNLREPQHIGASGQRPGGPGHIARPRAALGGVAHKQGDTSKLSAMPATPPAQCARGNRKGPARPGSWPRPPGVGGTVVRRSGPTDIGCSGGGDNVAVAAVGLGRVASAEVDRPGRWSVCCWLRWRAGGRNRATHGVRIALSAWMPGPALRRCPSGGSRVIGGPWGWPRARAV